MRLAALGMIVTLGSVILCSLLVVIGSFLLRDADECHRPAFVGDVMVSLGGTFALAVSIGGLFNFVRFFDLYNPSVAPAM